MPIKSYSYSAIGLTTVILILTFIILTSATTYAQVFTFSNTHTNQSADTSTNKNNNPLLLASLHLAKSALHHGDKQTITVVVLNKKSGTAITGASVLGKISSPNGLFKNVKGITDDTGKASYSWMLGDADVTRKYKVSADVSVPSYEKYSTSKTFKVIPVTYNNNNPPAATTIPSTPDNTDNGLSSSTTESPLTILYNPVYPATTIPSTPDNTDNNNNNNNNNNPPAATTNLPSSYNKIPFILPFP